MSNSIAQILKEHNLKVTPFRSEVVSMFSESQHALSMSDIEAKLEHADRITLYRTIKSFEDKGIIHKVNDGTLVQKYAICESACTEHSHADEHVHFHCTLCLNTFCLDHVFVPTVNLPSGFNISHAQMTVSGICQQCSTK